MSYFSDHYDKLKWPIAANGRVGFRPAQIAAAQAVGAHFFALAQPAIVTMPTGAGKTTVLMAVAFLLRASRVLVLTPSRLVREQIAENFGALVDLKKVEAVPHDLASPKVFATDGTIGTDEQWERLRQYDVVVATVPSVSPRDGAIPEPPNDLFDLVLVDEAHHAPARTWSRLLDLLRQAKQVLFTATPFRRDDKEIKGKLVFHYDLRRAYEDRVFGDITFQPVQAPPDVPIDVAIARATEAKFRQDRAGGLAHLVMVRADTLTRANELKEIYATNTGLNLAFVNGSHSLGHVKRIVQRLRRAELDGIVCVNMFGEGFNLPNLKIAAVHSPHKSLAVTLQFIGRFARAGQADIGGATFLAEPMSSRTEIGELYEAGAIWREIVHNLAGARIEAEVHMRDVVESFAIDAAPEMDDFSLYTVRPYFHAKVFSVPDGADLAAEPDFPEKLQIIFKGISDPHGAAVYLTREAVRSAWSTDERFTNIAYDIFIFHHNAEAGLLFICASRRHSQLYNRIARNIVGGRPRPLPQSSVSRALNDLDAMEFFSIGMRRRHRLGRSESYRMMTGPSVDRGIQDADGRLYDRGHCFGRGLDGGDEVTIGVSASSKVWSNTYDRIPELLDWCDRLAEKIASGRAAVTGSRLDLLSSGEELQQVPAGIIAMLWGPSVYRDPPLVFYRRADGTLADNQLLDFDLAIVASPAGQAEFVIRNSEIEWHGVFSLGGNDLFQPATNHEPDLVVHVRNEDTPIGDFLNDEAPSFLTADLSAIEGSTIFRMPPDLALVTDATFEVVDWATAGVNIQKEKPDGVGQRSIFEWLQERLVASPATVVFCDDGSGEIADFIALEETAAGQHVKMYHCKKSGAAQPGDRVDDLYEVAGQAVKSSMWLRPDELLEQLRYRASLPSIIGYLKGDEATASRLLGPEARRDLQFEIYIVQPGIHRDGRAERISQLLAAVDGHLLQGGVDRFGVICS